MYEYSSLQTYHLVPSSMKNNQEMTCWDKLGTYQGVTHQVTEKS